MNKNVFAIGMAASMLMLGSCSIFDKSQKYVVNGSEGKVSSEREVVVADGDAYAPGSGQVLTPPKGKGAKSGSSTKTASGKAVKNKKKGKDGSASVSKKELDGVRKNGAMTADSEPLGGTTAPAVNAAYENSTVPADFTINGDWTIYSVRDNIVTGEERPYIFIDLAAHRFYGNNGCNIVNGDVSVADGQKLEMTNLISTMKMCQDSEYEYLINLALSDVKSYGVRQEGSITFLDLKGQDGKTLLVLRRHNMDFLNGAWKITELNGTPLVQEDDATMTINIPDLQIHGTTGCNIFNGKLFIDPDKRHSMQFVDIATTRMGCPPDSRETEFLLGLESVESARPMDDGFVGMYDTEGKLVFKMQRIELKEAEGEGL